MREERNWHGGAAGGGERMPEQWCQTDTHSHLTCAAVHQAKAGETSSPPKLFCSISSPPLCTNQSSGITLKCLEQKARALKFHSIHLFGFLRMAHFILAVFSFSYCAITNHLLCWVLRPCRGRRILIFANQLTRKCALLWLVKLVFA